MSHCNQGKDFFPLLLPVADREAGRRKEVRWKFIKKRSRRRKRKERSKKKLRKRKSCALLTETGSSRLREGREWTISRCTHEEQEERERKNPNHRSAAHRLTEQWKKKNRPRVLYLTFSLCLFNAKIRLIFPANTPAWSTHNCYGQPTRRKEGREKHCSLLLQPKFEAHIHVHT